MIACLKYTYWHIYYMLYEKCKLYISYLYFSYTARSHLYYY